MSSLDARIPVVGAFGYVEHARLQPSSFTATLVVEPDNRYFRHAVAVLAAGQKIGYVAPEIAPNVYDAIAASVGPVTCPARRATKTDIETSGVGFFLDLTALSLPTGA